MNKIEEKWVPKVGEYVKLIHSKDNWSEIRDGETLSMTEIFELNPIVKVTKVIECLRNNDIEIKFKNSTKCWSWCLKNGHFEKYDGPEIKKTRKKKENLKYLIPFLNNLK